MSEKGVYRERRCRLLLGLPDRQGDGVNRARVIAQLDVKRLALRRWDDQCVFDEAFGDTHRIAEIGVSADRIEQEQLVPAEGALLFRCWEAVNSGEHRETNQTDQRLPVPAD